MHVRPIQVWSHSLVTGCSESPRHAKTGLVACPISHAMGSSTASPHSGFAPSTSGVAATCATAQLALAMPASTRRSWKPRLVSWSRMLACMHACLLADASWSDGSVHWDSSPASSGQNKNHAFHAGASLAPQRLGRLRLRVVLLSVHAHRPQPGAVISRTEAGEHMHAHAPAYGRGGGRGGRWPCAHGMPWHAKTHIFYILFMAL